MRVYTLAEFPPTPGIGLLTLEESEGRFYNDQETESRLLNYHRDQVNLARQCGIHRPGGVFLKLFLSVAFE